MQKMVAKITRRQIDKGDLVGKDKKTMTVIVGLLTGHYTLERYTHMHNIGLAEAIFAVFAKSSELMFCAIAKACGGQCFCYWA